MRPGAGRKPLPTEERLRNRVMFTLSDREYEELVAAAGAEKLSTFVRRVVVRRLGRRR